MPIKTPITVAITSKQQAKMRGPFQPRNDLHEAQLKLQGPKRLHIVSQLR